MLKETLSGASYTQSTVAGSPMLPQGVAVDGSGNVYIADRGNNRVLKETLSGGSYTQSTIANSGLSQPFGVAVDGSGNVYIADTNNKRILKEDFATPPSLNFAKTSVGARSADSPQTVTISNIGNLPLTIPAATTGTNPSIASGFQYDGASTCPSQSTGATAFTLNAGPPAAWPSISCP